MRFSKLLLILFFTFCFPTTVFAAVGVSSTELQDSLGIILPSGDSIGELDGYGAFSLQSSSLISNGIKAVYKARLSSDPWFNDELPQLELMVYSYGSQESAEYAFESLSNLSSFSNGTKTRLLKEDRSLFYMAEGGNNVDVFGDIDAEYESFHFLHVNGNILYQASIFREDGTFNQLNVETFDNAISNRSNLYEIMDGVIENVKLGLGILFPPTSTDLSAKSERSSLNLSSLYDIPHHGNINFELYVGEPEGAVGTILDSSGISTAEEGDLYLYVHSDGRLYAGIYAPDFDADCEQQSGWYRIGTSSSLNSYEWNSVSLHFGVGGFWIELNDEIDAICRVAQPRSDRDLYFGDFPDDSIDESMIGYVNDLSSEYSRTDSGLIWEDVLTKQLFLDLSNMDSDLPVFQYLKEEGIFLGSDGMLYPENYLNRAEMVKILLKAYGYTIGENSYIPFWDVPADAWYIKYLARAYYIKMITGHVDGRFLPGHEINRAEFFTMLYRISDEGKIAYDDEYLDVSSTDWFLNGAAFALDHNLVTGKYFEPSALVTRRDAARALYILLNE